MSTFRNLLLLCTLACLIIGGFTLLTDQGPAMVSGDSAQQTLTPANDPGPHTQSSFAVILGIAGLVYLKIIWKLIHLSNDSPSKNKTQGKDG